MKRTLFFLASMLIAASSFVMTACNPDDDGVKVASISITSATNNEMSVVKGQTANVTVSVLPTDADNKAVTYKSSDDAIFTVNADGVITAVAVGQATLTVTAKDGSKKSATCTVNVLSDAILITGITLASTEESILPGATFDVTEGIVIAPANATNQTLEFTSSDTEVATVSSAGVVTGIADGEATITVKATDGSEVEATCEISVSSILVEEIEIASGFEAQSILPGATFDLGAKITVSPSDATVKTLSYSSSDTEVATVSPAGVVTGVAVGEATITVSATDGSEVTATCEITVYVVPVASIVYVNSTESIFVGATLDLSTSLTILPTDATNKGVEYSSDDATVASVTAAGVVKALKVGSTTVHITAKDGSGVTTSVQINAAPVAVTGISFNPTGNYNVGVGNTLALAPQISVLPANATDKTRSYSSNAPAIATVDPATGVVTGVAAGTATITVSSVSNPSVSVTQDVTVYTLYATTGWEVTASATHDGGTGTIGSGDNQPPNVVLNYDFTTYPRSSTYWHSPWAGWPDPRYPIWLMVDMKTAQSVAMVEIGYRGTTGNYRNLIKEGKLEYSTDGETWTTISTLGVEVTKVTQPYDSYPLATPVTARDRKSVV